MAILNKDVYARYLWVSTHTQPGEYFFEADDNDLYFPFLLRNPATVYMVTPFEFTRPEQIMGTVEALEKHKVRFILWDPYFLEYTYEPRYPGDHLNPLRLYLRKHYRVVKLFRDSSYEVWRRDK